MVLTMVNNGYNPCKTASLIAKANRRGSLTKNSAKQPTVPAEEHIFPATHVWVILIHGKCSTDFNIVNKAYVLIWVFTIFTGMMSKPFLPSGQQPRVVGVHPLLPLSQSKAAGQDLQSQQSCTDPSNQVATCC